MTLGENLSCLEDRTVSDLQLQRNQREYIPEVYGEWAKFGEPGNEADEEDEDDSER